ncbi:MAG: LysE family transporter [Thermoproteota archaeon]|nr:LysE family transporter [Candidatus Brockarchaeota archaeon]
MDLISWILEVQTTTASGALSPGPLTIATASSGVKIGGKAGFLAALGHTVVEFPLVLLLSFGILSVLPNEMKSVLSFLGGSALLFFAFSQFKSIHSVEIKLINTNRNSFLTGLLLTAFNPYFIIWWLTVGAKMLMDSINLFSFQGVFFMYLLHVWMDFVWLMFIAYVFHKGSKISNSTLKVALILLGCLMIYFGLKFIYDAITQFRLA